MPKPIVSQREKQVAESVCNVKKCNASNSFSKTRLDKLLRKQRSKGYVDMICELDAGGHVTNQDKVNQIIEKIKDEFPEIDISPILLGIVSTCYLEKPYEVHTLDIEGGVLEHYKKGQVVRRHIVGGTYRTLISVQNPLRLCRTGICRSLSAG